MNNISRKRNYLKNLSFGFLNQITVFILSFVSRTVFIYYLGAEYLGINSLFYNILYVLSIADLGFGNAILFHLYKPIAENDKEKIKGYVTFFKNAYIIVGAAILVLGLCVIPFLDKIVNLPSEMNNIILIYILFLLDSSLSYFACHKKALIEAHQKTYVLNNISLICYIITTVLQLVFLYVTKDYIIYLIIKVICTVLNNYMIVRYANKNYPYCNEKGHLNKVEKKSLFESIKSLFIYKIGSALLYGTDNIIISMTKTLGTIVVGIYSNYNMIIESLNKITTVIFTSLMSIVGNFNSTENLERKKDLFLSLNLFSFWFYTVCTVCLYFVMDDFIRIWLNDSYVVGHDVLIAILVNYYIVGILQPIWIFRDTTGLFNKTKNIFLLTAFINIIASIILTNLMGLSGVIFGTVIARLTTSVWFEPYVIYKDYFHENVSKYFLKQLVYLLIFFIVFGLTYIICNQIQANDLISLFFKGSTCFLVINLLLLVFFIKTKDFKKMIKMVKK